MTPRYDLDKIKFATDPPTFQKAVDLYVDGKITQFKEEFSAYTAIVLGTKPYSVFIKSRRFYYGRCDCYLGQNETLCKHQVALAIHAVKRGQPLTDEEKHQTTQVSRSNQLGTLSKTKFSETKKSISAALRYIKPYEGPSRIWFAYQDSLTEGCNRLAKIVSDLPVSPQTAELLVNLLLRLDDKLCRGGVDDSDGTVGGFIEEAIKVLGQYAKFDPNCINAFKQLSGKQTCFGWEEPLLQLIGENTHV